MLVIAISGREATLFQGEHVILGQLGAVGETA